MTTEKKFWIINIHTRGCFGPYEEPSEGQEDIDNDPHPKDWVLVAPVRQKKKAKRVAEATAKTEPERASLRTLEKAAVERLKTARQLLTRVLSDEEAAGLEALPK